MTISTSLRLFAVATLLASAASYAGDVAGDAAGDAEADFVGDAVTGEMLFKSSACATCHGVTAGDHSKVGPNLVGLLGRKAGTTPSLLGSENLKKYGVTWSTATLNEFLADPNARVPGTAMVGLLTDPQQRADVIAYLSTLKP